MAERADLRPFTASDAADLLADLRPVDALEWRAMLGQEPSVAGLLDLVARSRLTTTARLHGRLCCIYGVISATHLSPVGNPWMLGTTLLEEREARRELVRLSPSELARLGAGYTRLWNAAAQENRTALRWLEWLGFTVARHSPVEVRGVPFVPFWKE